MGRTHSSGQKLLNQLPILICELRNVTMRVHHPPIQPPLYPATTNGSTTSSLTAAGSGTAATGQSTFATELAKFQNYVAGSPTTQVRAAILSQLGYTEDDLKRMNPALRKKIEDELNRRIRQHIDNETQRRVAHALAGQNRRG